MSDFKFIITKIVMIVVMIVMAVIGFIAINTIFEARETARDPKNMYEVLDSTEELQALKDNLTVSGSVNGSSFLGIGHTSGTVDTNLDYFYMTGNDEKGYKTQHVEGNITTLVPTKTNETPYIEKYIKKYNKDIPAMNIKKDDRVNKYCYSKYVIHIPKQDITALGKYEVNLE